MGHFLQFKFPRVGWNIIWPAKEETGMTFGLPKRKVECPMAFQRGGWKFIYKKTGEAQAVEAVHPGTPPAHAYGGFYSRYRKLEKANAASR